MGMEGTDGLLRNGREALALEEMPDALNGLSEVASRGRGRPRDRDEERALASYPAAGEPAPASSTRKRFHQEGYAHGVRGVMRHAHVVRVAST